MVTYSVLLFNREVLMSKKSAGFFLGAIFWCCAAGAVAGSFLAPRSGEETALAADAVNDGWIPHLILGGAHI